MSNLPRATLLIICPDPACRRCSRIRHRIRYYSCQWISVAVDTAEPFCAAAYAAHHHQTACTSCWDCASHWSHESRDDNREPLGRARHPRAYSRRGHLLCNLLPSASGSARPRQAWLAKVCRASQARAGPIRLCLGVCVFYHQAISLFSIPWRAVRGDICPPPPRPTSPTGTGCLPFLVRLSSRRDQTELHASSQYVVLREDRPVR